LRAWFDTFVATYSQLIRRKLMNPFGPTVRWGRSIAILPAIVLTMALVGCGSSQDAMEEEFGGMPGMTPAAHLESKIDSLMNENRKLRDQVDAMTTENRRLTAKAAELETKIAETTAAQAAVPVIPPPIAAPTSKARPAVAPTPEGASGYEAALAAFNSRNYTSAIEQFQALINSGSAGSRTDNCHYWIGEAYYGLGKHTDALQSFKSVLEFKRSGKIPYAYLMIGNCESFLGNKEAAKEAYTRAATDFPSSPVAAKAQLKLAKMK
jgi:tol-pal system protein YbgF